jgi:glucan 1,3-beta-glucosidase
MPSLLSFTAILAAAGPLVNAAPARCKITPTAVANADFPSTLHERGVDFNWGSDKVRGVNLGGWLVLES